MLSVHFADDQKARLINAAGWNFDQIKVIPESLRLNEINPVLFLIGCAFLGSNSKSISIIIIP
jgi:hypothetical protein